MVHVRYSGRGQPVSWIIVDILRIEDGMLVEHWDVIQDEATQEQSKSGLPMFGNTITPVTCILHTLNPILVHILFDYLIAIIDGGSKLAANYNFLTYQIL
jgi:hypothetical protein